MIKLKYKSRNDHTNAIEYLKSVEFVKVKTKYSKGTDWTALSLRGYLTDPKDILKPNVLQKQIDNSSKAVVQTDFTDLFFDSEIDSITQIVDDLYKKYALTFQRVRLMKLNAHTKIDKHTDKIDKEFLNKDNPLLRLHLPIKTNDKVSFSIWNGQSSIRGQLKVSKILETNQLYLVDVTKPHSVVNNSNEDRIHLVLDCYDTANLLFAPNVTPMKETVKWFNQKVIS